MSYIYIYLYVYSNYIFIIFIYNGVTSQCNLYKIELGSTPRKLNSSPLKIGRDPKESDLAVFLQPWILIEQQKPAYTRILVCLKTTFKISMPITLREFLHSQNHTKWQRTQSAATKSDMGSPPVC